MTDTTITKVDGEHSSTGQMGQKYLASGQSVAMRLWEHEQPGDVKPPVARDYETVGYVLAGAAILTVNGQTTTLRPGDSWLVPQGALHTYQIQEPFTAVEATSPPAQGRDEAGTL